MKPVSQVSLVFVATALFAAAGCSRPANRTILQNSSGQAVSNVMLTLRTLDDSWQVSTQAVVVASGQRLTIFHRQNDTKLALSYDFRGLSTNHANPYVDLWTGEGWMLDIQPDGSVVENYESQSKKE